MTIGEAVKKARQRMGWNQETLAEVIQVSQSAISLIEQGRRQPSYTIVRFVSVACRVSFAITGKDVSVRKAKR